MAGERHAASGAAPGEALPEPSFAERARTLVHLGRSGTLVTQSRRLPGFPFGSVALYAVDAAGRPSFLVSTMAMHTQNLLADPHASLLVTQPGWSDDPLAGARVTLVGTVAQVPPAETSARATPTSVGTRTRGTGSISTTSPSTGSSSSRCTGWAASARWGG